MSEPVAKLTGDWLTCRQSVALLAMFRANGITTRFVGGVVRNALLGEPINDLDMATDAEPQTVIKLAQQAGFKAIGTGMEHGTVTVVVAGRIYEVTTLRVDVESHGRHATVAFTDNWHEDAARRDFTMNALYAEGDGTVFDPLGGYGDVLARRVRFIGKPDDRIKEDALRILRFFRFSAQYGQGVVDEDGLKACVRSQGLLRALSSERIRSEFLRLLLMPKVTPVLDTMFAHGLLLPLIFRVPHLARFIGWLNLEERLDRVPSAIDRLGALGVLVPEDAQFLAKQLRLSNSEKSALARWALDVQLDDQVSERQAHRLFYRFGKDYQTITAIAWVRRGFNSRDEAWCGLYALPERWRPPSFPVTGQDLLAHGMEPGRLVGKQLQRLESQWIDSDFTLSKKALLQEL